MLILVCCTATVAAQEVQARVQEFRLGLNAAVFGQGDQMGIGNYAEYSYSFNDRLAIATRIMSANGVNNSDPSTYRTSLWAGVISARFTPFPDTFNRLQLDVGPTYNRITTSYTRYQQIGQSSSAYGVHEEREHLVGVLGSLNLIILHGARMQAGMSFSSIASLRRGDLHGEVAQAGIFLGIRF